MQILESQACIYSICVYIEDILDISLSPVVGNVYPTVDALGG